MGLKTTFVHWARNEQGATALEYGLIIGVMVIAIIGAIGAIGASLAGTFEDSSDAINVTGN